MESTRLRRRKGPREGEEDDGRLEFKLSGNLPSEIILDILTRLPLKSLSTLRWVCKSWFNTITHARFAHTHHINSLQNKTSPCVLLCNYRNFALVDHQPFDEHQVLINAVNIKMNQFDPKLPSVLGSVNGLVCLSLASVSSFERNEFFTTFCVWNPITLEQAILPESPNSHKTGGVSGFGFESTSNEYKVIQIFCEESMGRSYPIEAEIYSVGSAKWRKIENAPFLSFKGQSGAFASGSLHWLTHESNNEQMFNVLIIASFNLKTEKFGVLRLPLPIMSSTCYKKFLNMFEDQLCIVDLTSDDEIQIWVMEHYGVNESWSKKYVLEKHVMVNLGRYRMLKVKAGELLLWGYKSYSVKPSTNLRIYEYEEIWYLSYYEPQTKVVQPIHIKTDLLYWGPFVFHGSLCSPNNVEGSTGRRFSGFSKGSAPTRNMRTEMEPVRDH